MKAFFWKQLIIDPNKAEHKTFVWSKVKQYEITEKFMEKVVEAFHDKKALTSSATSGGGAEAVIKVTGP